MLIGAINQWNQPQVGLRAVHPVGTARVATTGAVRQVAVRARKHVRATRPRYPVEREEGDRIATAFFTASRSGDIAALRAMLAQTVVLQADGGGKVHAFLDPIVGLERVLRLFGGLHRKRTVQPAVFIEAMSIDGLPGFASLERDGVLQPTALAIENSRITGVYITRNPYELSHVARALAAHGAATCFIEREIGQYALRHDRARRAAPCARSRG